MRHTCFWSPATYDVTLVFQFQETVNSFLGRGGKIWSPIDFEMSFYKVLDFCQRVHVTPCSTCCLNQSELCSLGDSDLQILITSERVLVFCIGSSAGGADNRASSAGSMSSAVTKHLRTVSHFDLISAKAVFDQDESSAAPR